MTNNHNITLERNPIFEVSSSLHPPIFLLSSSYLPPIFLLSSSYQSRIDPVLIPYRNTETIRKQYGIDTGAIRK